MQSGGAWGGVRAGDSANSRVLGATDLRGVSGDVSGAVQRDGI